MLTLRLPEDLISDAVKLARADGISLNRFSEQIFRAALDEAKKKQLKADFELIASDLVDDDEAWTRLGRETLDHE